MARQSLNTVGIYAVEMLADLQHETHIGRYIAALFNNSKVLEILSSSGMERPILVHTRRFSTAVRMNHSYML